MRCSISRLPGSFSWTAHSRKLLAAEETRRGEPTQLLLATRSEGKLRELKGMVEKAGFHATTLSAAAIPHSPAEDLIECYDTFEENALAKARYFHVLTGLPTVADDSGLR